MNFQLNILVYHKRQYFFSAISAFTIMLSAACAESPATVVETASLDFKKSEIISSGAEDGKLVGTVSFTSSVPTAQPTDFNNGIALLHAFESNKKNEIRTRII